jgi:hypothetical protein
VGFHSLFGGHVGRDDVVRDAVVFELKFGQEPWKSSSGKNHGSDILVLLLWVRLSWAL